MGGLIVRLHYLSLAIIRLHGEIKAVVTKCETDHSYSHPYQAPLCLLLLG